MKLTGKVAIVTGAGRGVGRATALRLAEEGARVIIAEQQTHVGEETRRVITQAGGEARAIRTDVSQTTDVERMVKEALAWAGHIDILVQCAGIENRPGPLTRCRASDFDRVMAVNVRGPFLCTREIVKRMLEQGRGGHILALASYAATRPVPDLAPYAASKAATIALMRCVAAEVADHGITVHTICPGPIAGPGEKPPARQTGGAPPAQTPEAVAEALLAIVTGEADYPSGESIDLTANSVAN